MGMTSRIARTVDVDVVRHGSMELVRHRDVARFLDGCDTHDVLILGIEGFRLDGTTIEPDMGAILDCSSVSQPDESRAGARIFIDKMPTTELVYEFVFRDEQQRVPEPQRQRAEAIKGPVTPEQVHNVSFSEASHGHRGYHQGEVDALLDRLEAALRDTAARGVVTPAEIQNSAFSKPPFGQRGYDEDEVDAFLDLVRGELSRRTSGQGPEQPRRFLLYRIGSRTPGAPALAIDLDKHAIRVIDPSSNATVASASLMHVIATPAQHGGGPVLVLDIPGMQQLTIQPHLIDRFSLRRSAQLAGRLPSKKSDYLVLDEDWYPLVGTFGVDPDLGNLPTPRKIYSHISDFFLAAHRPGFSWQWFVLFGVVVLIPACIYWAPTVILIGVASLIMAAVAWYFGWGQRRGG